ncbi:MAG: DUF4179 domain-containing protein [Oscillospiraceae bacterium]|nr:DUF4179 domain-containing protein [Oscillospiraceae bacterium]
MTALELAMAMGETEDRYAKTVFSPPAKRKLSRPVRAALILAAVIALLALLGVAARETGFLERLFPGEKYETFEDYVNHIGVTVENEGLRLTLHEAVTDGYNTYLVYSVELLRGNLEDWDDTDHVITPLTEEGYPVKLGGGVRQPLDGDDPGQGNPNRWVYLWYNESQMNTGRIRFRLFGLKNYDTGETFNPGYLEAEAELKPCLAKISKEQGDGVYSNIVLSPFGLRADVAGMDMKKLGNGKPFRGKLEYVYREGEEEQKIFDSPGLRPDPVRQDVAVMSAWFRQPVDIRGIVALRIDGVEYPLETGPIPKQPQQPMEQTQVPELSAEDRQALRESLFADCTPEEVEYAADNGVYRLETRSLALWGNEEELHLRAWIKASVLKGAYDRLLDQRDIAPYLCVDGTVLGISWTGGKTSFYDAETGERVFALSLDFTRESANNAAFDGDFGKVTALRLVWTPPAGDRIVLDLERTV